MLRVSSQQVASRVVHGAYIVLYSVAWPASTLAIVLATVGQQGWFVTVGLLLGLCTVVTWFVSHRKLARWHRQNSPSLSVHTDDVLPHRTYIMPFAYALSWILVAKTVWGLVNFELVEPPPRPRL